MVVGRVGLVVVCGKARVVCFGVGIGAFDGAGRCHGRVVRGWGVVALGVGLGAGAV